MVHGVYSELSLRTWLQRQRVLFPIIMRSRASAILFLAVAPAALYAILVPRVVTGDRWGSDLVSFWEGGRRVLHGLSPYPALASLPAVADRVTFVPYVYPPPAAWAMTPLSVLPFAVADTLFLLLTVGCVVLALRLLDVTDWRCYGAAFVSVPMYSSAALGALSPMLLLGAAAAWRYRNSAWRVAPVVAALVVAKLFLWPMWLWLVYTRRFKAAVLSAVLGFVGTVLAWGAIGFAGLRDYPQLLSRLTELVGTQSYSIYALFRAGGLPAGGVTQAIVFAAGIAAAVLVVRIARRERADERAFVAGIGLALLTTPILWPHYLVLLFVPVAFARKSLSGLWLAMLFLWLDGNGWSNGYPQLIIPALIIGAAPFVYALREAR